MSGYISTAAIEHVTIFSLMAFFILNSIKMMRDCDKFYSMIHMLAPNKKEREEALKRNSNEYLAFLIAQMFVMFMVLYCFSRLGSKMIS
jgi:predicted PurR-regulated permease PerM